MRIDVQEKPMKIAAFWVSKAEAADTDFMNSLKPEFKAYQEQIVKNAKENSGLRFIEVKCSIGARDDLGRPTTTPKENKESFMNNL